MVRLKLASPKFPEAIFKLSIPEFVKIPTPTPNPVKYSALSSIKLWKIPASVILFMYKVGDKLEINSDNKEIYPSLDLIHPTPKRFSKMKMKYLNLH